MSQHIAKWAKSKIVQFEITPFYKNYFGWRVTAQEQRKTFYETVQTRVEQKLKVA